MSRRDRDVVVIGGSAGALEPLLRIVAGLPRGQPAAVLVVIHTAPEGESVLPLLLTRAGALPAAHPAGVEELRPGRIYVAPPDLHLLLEDGLVRLMRGPRENRARPAVDPLFRSAALHHGPRVVGIVLSGALDDGTAGLGAIAKRGGHAIVQDPREALYPSMPASALRHVPGAEVVPAAEIAPLVARLAREAAPEPAAAEESARLHRRMARTARTRRDGTLAERFERRSAEAERHAQELRKALLTGAETPAEDAVARE